MSPREAILAVRCLFLIKGTRTNLEKAEKKGAPEHIISLRGIFFRYTRLKNADRVTVGTEGHILWGFASLQHTDGAPATGIQSADCNGRVVQDGGSVDQMQNLLVKALIACSKLVLLNK